MNSANILEYQNRLREALAFIAQLKSKLETAQRAKSEPIAIVGMACRFPGGGTNPDAFFRALEAGVDGIREVPAERWPADAIPNDQPDPRWAGLLDNVGHFDAHFFEISPREAESLDPQQRLLLEIAWEALDSAGQRQDRLKGSKTGVFLGASSLDYQQRCFAQNIEKLDGYVVTGNMASTAAGRISFTLGLQGPCMIIDTACSSSLVAVHLACQSLRNQESDLAVTGGVHLLLAPMPSYLMARLRALSPDGRCKTFDSRANGYVRGEGCGTIILKRLSDAQRDKDRILAVIRGSAVNQDGRSSGLTTPNVLAQKAVLRQALSMTKLSSQDIGYIETHGTGTPLGDPIEVAALRDVYGDPRPDGTPCILGAVKTNIGHLEAAAGIAGLIKTIQIFQTGIIPKNLHFRAQNPRIDIAGSALEFSTSNRTWLRSSKIRRAGISSFGISGTNAHVIVEEAPADEPRISTEQPSTYFLPLSAKTTSALAASASSIAEWLGTKIDTPLLDIVSTASLHRTHHEYRLAAIGRTHEELASVLRAFVQGEDPAEVVKGRALPNVESRLVFVFSGQGSQWAGMGKTLLAEQPVFRAKVEEIDALVRRHASFSVLDELQAPEAASRLGETEIVQPALFALQVGLVELFKSWGIVPHGVIGHSIGEVAAAHASGAISLENAVRLVVLRGRIMQKATGLGKMVWVALPASEAEQAIAGLTDKLSVAAINDPSSVVLSGETNSLDGLIAVLDQRGVLTRPLRVNYAFHSPQMEPLALELVATLGRIDAHASPIPMYSTVTGTRIDGGSLSAEYWGRNIRATVNLADAVRCALDEAPYTLVEMGPHPVLLANLEQCVTAQQASVRVIPTLRRQGDDIRELMKTLGSLYATGVESDWKKLWGDQTRVISLPSYPWQRERYWIEPPKKSTVVIDEAGDHPLLGKRLSPASQPELHLWERRVSVEAFPYLDDHRVQGDVVFPGAGYVEMALAATNRVYGEHSSYLEELHFEHMLTFERDEVRIVQVALVEENGGRAAVTISSKRDGTKEWVRHVSGTARVMATSAPAPTTSPSIDSLLQNAQVIDAKTHYERMLQSGLLYGPAFQGVEQVRLGKGEIVAHVQFPRGVDDIAKHGLHPTALDACFQAAGWALGAGKAKGTFVPVKIRNVRFYRRPEGSLWIHGRMSPTTTDQRPILSLSAQDAQGKVPFEIGELELQAIDTNDMTRVDPFEHCILQVQWRKTDSPTNPPKGTQRNNHWLVLLDDSGVGTRLTAYLRARGDQVTTTTSGIDYAILGQNAYRLDSTNPQHWAMLFASAFGRNGCQRVIHCGALDGAPWEDTAETTLRANVRQGPLATLRLTQAILKQDWPDAPRLYLLTRGAQSVGLKLVPVFASQSMLWGVGRTLAMEHPELHCTQIDLSPEATPDELVLIVRELGQDNEEDQIALRPEGRFVARLIRGSWNENVTAERTEDARGRPYRLETREPGVLEKLCLRPMQRRAPGAGEVEIEVEASGLNFLDVMKAMGIYPGMDRNSIRLGGECAGRIVAIGPEVWGFEVGQEVIASASGAFATHVTTRAEFVAPVPSGLSFEQAATIPSVFMTVHWALHHLGRLRRGERILIHSATGGTGIAAVQYAKDVGAEIFATAGNEEKRNYLRSLGIAHVMNSRTLQFADEILAKTNGRGVDVVLNSLTGDALVKSLEVLAPYGRFLEIGKKDIYENKPLGLLPFRKSLSYMAVDLAGMAEERPEQFGALLHEVVAKFQNGSFHPEPVTTFSANEAESAFRLLAQARHIGKIAVRMRDPAATVMLADVDGIQIRSEGTYLITGGLGGLGLSLAQWLIEKGAKHLVLVGRSAPNPAAKQALQDMKTNGALVRVVRADVARRADVDAMMADIERTMPPLRGVVHAAGTLADRTLLDMNEDEFFRAIDPKVFGAWNLHEVTKELPLDFFVMYSSVAGLTGSPGQANYAAANAFLDALCRSRAATGLPAMSIQWGAFSDVGMAAASDTRGKRIALLGSQNFTAAEGNALFDRLLHHPRTEVGLMRIDFSQWQASSIPGARSAFLRELVAKPDTEATPKPQDSLVDKLGRVTPDERIIVLEEHVAQRVGQVLRLDPSRIDRLATFSSLGMDSLMGLELRNRLEPDLGQKLSATLLFAHPTPAALAAYLLQRLAITDDAPPTRHSSAMHREPPAPETRAVVAIPTLVPASAPPPMTVAEAQSPPSARPPTIATVESKSPPSVRPPPIAIVEPPMPPPRAPEPETDLEVDLPSAEDDIEARLAAKLASLDKYLD